MSNPFANKGDKFTFQILFTSDIHGAFRDYNYATDKETSTNGFSKIATLLRYEKQSFDGTTFIVDTGDILQGNGTSVLMKELKYSPFPLLAAFDAVGYDIVSIGNHEFNFGIPAMYKAFEGYKGEKLCGNVFDSDGNLLKDFSAYTIKEFDNGLRVAFIGMVSPNIDKWDKKNVLDAGYNTKSVADETRKVVDYLTLNDLADIFIMLGHMDENNEMDRIGSGANDVIEKNPELAVFLGAHFHIAKGTRKNQLILKDMVKFVENKASAASFGKVLITAAFENGKWGIKNKIGTYEQSDVKTDVIEIANDSEVEKATADAHEYVKEYMRMTVVGKLEGGSLVPEPEIKGTHEVVLRPTPLIQLVTDVMLHYTKADIAAAAPNDFSVNCQEGDITQGKIVQIYVYDNNTLYTLKMTGEQIVKWMEWSYSYFGSTVNGIADKINPAVNLDTDLTIPYGTRKIYQYDQFAGIKYDVDLTKPVGQRINVLSMQNGSKFDLAGEYTVAAGNYRATTNLVINSQDGIFKPGEKTAEVVEMDIQSPKGSSNMLELIAEYIDSMPDKTITNKCSNNWEFVNLNWDKGYREKAIDAINDGRITYDYRQPVTKMQV